MKQPITRSRLFVQHFNLLGENLQKKCIFRDIITSIINSRNEQTELIFFFAFVYLKLSRNVYDTLQLTVKKS